jgi:hypothetical protein
MSGIVMINGDAYGRIFEIKPKSAFKEARQCHILWEQ